MLSKIMKTAWNIFRANKGCMNFSEALRMAWIAVRNGATHVASISTDRGIVLVGGASSDETNKARIAKTWELVNAKRRVYCDATHHVARHIAG